MTIDPQWQLLKAAESALRSLEALINVDWQDDVSGVLHEAEASAEFLGEAIAAAKPANMCQADEVPAAVSSSLPTVALQSGSQWRPIETAPRDREILVCSDLEFGEWSVANVKWCTDCWRDSSGEVVGRYFSPLYWMAFLTPPAAKPSASSEERSDDE